MDKIQTLKTILNKKRLEVLRSLDLLDTPAEEAFDRSTRLASKMTNSPVALVSLVDANRQFFKSQVGLSEPVASDRETPLSHSFCQHVVASNEPLIIEDARKDPVLKDNLAIPDLNVIAYLGMPLTLDDGTALGSFCVIDDKPRKWSADDIEAVRDFAALVMSEIRLRTEIQSKKKSEDFLNTVITHLPIVVYALDENGTFTLSEGKGLDELGLKPGQVVGLSAWDLYRNNSTAIQGITKAFSGIPTRAFTPSGEMIYDAWYEPVFDAARKVTGVVGCCSRCHGAQKSRSNSKNKSKVHQNAYRLRHIATWRGGGSSTRFIASFKCFACRNWC